ncbi:MAG: MFS transporter, partial [Dehalococcoidia bacterium]|nr:MFS transporter [Dehalococcoidia bacterium]
MGSINAVTFGVFFKPIAGDFDWSRGAMSGSYAVRSVVCAAFAPVVGYLSDRYGPRWVLLACSALFAICFLALARIDALWQLYLVQGLFMGMASSGPFVCLTSTVAKWHTTRRGLALGIASAGYGLSSIIFPPLATALIQAIRWQGALTVLGILMAIIAVPASLMLRDPPRPSGPPASSPAPQRGPFQGLRMLLELARSREFMAVVLMVFFLYFAYSLVPSHLVNYATDIGIGVVAAAAMLSVMGAMNTAGRFAMGHLSDLFGSRVAMVTSSA